MLKVIRNKIEEYQIKRLLQPKNKTKLLKKIKQKVDKIEKLKTEVINMSKYELKDGKIVKQSNEESNIKQSEQPQTAQPVEQPQQTQPSLEQYEQPVHQQVQQEQNGLPVFDNQQPIQPIDPARLHQHSQPIDPVQYQQQSHEQIHDLMLTLVTGDKVRIEVDIGQAQSTVNEITEALDLGTSIVVGNRIINSRNVLFFDF